MIKEERVETKDQYMDHRKMKWCGVRYPHYEHMVSTDHGLYHCEGAN